MFNFIEKEAIDAKVSEEYIDELEKKLGIKFPMILREYYLQHNGAEIKECRFKKFDLEFCVVLLRALNYGTVSLEETHKYTSSNKSIPSTFISIAVDEDEDDYYWDSNSGKVYYLSLANVEHPKEIFSSVEEFFEILNKCGDSQIVMLDNEEGNNKNLEIQNINKQIVSKRNLSYNGKFASACIFIGIILIVISLLLIPFTDGLSILFAGVFVIYTLIFIIIDRVMKNKTGKIHK